MAYNTNLLGRLRARWSSGKHVGAARPVMRCYVRTVKLQRRFRQLEEDAVYATVPGLEGGARTIWMGKWVPKTAWRLMPNVRSASIDQDFDQNGIATCNLEIDNVELVQATGINGIFHMIKRGWYSPWRGYSKGRPKVAEKNEWFDVLNDKSTQIIVLAGYGDAVVPIFEGLVNDFDIASRPDMISLVCRDGGQTLSDQNVFINAKVRNVRDPITFCDRNQADKTEPVGTGAQASDSHGGHPARFVLDESDTTEWKSADRDNAHPANLPWVEISIPDGRYDSVRLHPRYAGMTMYLAIKARDRNAPGGEGAKEYQGPQHYPDNDWIDAGKGDVPGTSVPFVAKIDQSKARPDQTFQFPGHGYLLGDDTKLRVYFDNLDYGQAENGDGRAYRAGVIDMRGISRSLMDEARKEKWILVDDLADVVRTVFQWCGLNDWEVETTGVRLGDKSVWNRGNHLIDIVQAAAEQVGYVFYFKPREHFSEDEEDLEDLTPDNSMGIAVFRQSQAMRKGRGIRDPVELIHEDKTATGVHAHFTDEPLASIIRVRGKEKRDGNGGRPLGGDRIERAMYVYLPPWARFGDQFRNANIKKYVVHHDEQLRNGEECEIAALFIAFREALESATAQFEAPCMPTIHLDHQCSVFDTGTGLSTRVWIALKQVSYQGGEQGHFKMSLGGALLDLKDTQDVREELVKSLRKRGYDPGLSDWELEHFGDNYRSDF